MRFASCACGRRGVRSSERVAGAWRAAARAALLIAVASGVPAARAGEERPATHDAAAAAWERAMRGLALPAGVRWIESPPGLDAEAAETALRAAGFAPAVSIPPSVHVVRAGADRGPLPPGFRDRTADAAGTAPGGETLPGSPPRAPAAHGVAAAPPADPFGGRADVLPPSRLPSSAVRSPGHAPSAATVGDLPAGLFYGTRWEDISEFLIGRVAIGILFPESDGSVDVNRYDWTPALRDSVVRSAVRGFLKWTDEAALRGLPLSFHLEVHPSIPIRYEPITRPVSQEGLWIEDMLRQLVGYRGDPTSMGTEFANALRGRLGAHWAGLVIAVQNDSSSTGSFPDGLIAHARLGGPWFVIPVNNLNTTSATLDFYMEHELAHIFWALDEFPAVNAWWSCTLTSGYFDRANLNSSIPLPGYCGMSENCVMRGNYPDAFCLPTREQVGWADLDHDAVHDLYETPPAVLPDSSRYRTSAGMPLLLRGKVAETALPNRNPYRFYSGDSISVSVIDSLFYRVDGGAWVSVPPLDGQYDEGSEPFEVLLDPLPVGSHTIEWDARNRNGRGPVVTASTAVTISGSSASVEPPGSPAGLRLSLGPIPARRSVRFTIDGGTGAHATVRVWSAGGRLARSWTVSGGGPATWTWDGRLANGTTAPNGVYFVTLEAGSERLTRRLVWVR